MITNGYCTTDDLKRHLDVYDVQDDVLLERAIEAGSRAVDGFCGRSFYQQPNTTRHYRADFADHVRTADLVSVSALVTDDGSGTYATVWDATDYQLDGDEVVTRIYAAPLGAHRFPVGLRRGVRVTGAFGWAEIPQSVQAATILLASRYFKRKDSPLGIQVGKPEFGALSIPGKDPDVERLLQPYRAYALIGGA